MRDRLIRRLESYWKLEALNVVLVPGAAIAAVLHFGDSPSWPLMLAAVACAVLLAIGAAAWRIELQGLKGNAAFETRVLPHLARWQAPSLVLALLALPAAAYELWRDAGWTPSAIATAALAVLSVLEYVNYYKVQLQHFDNLPDLRRLLSGRGFREAHLARALRRWRNQAPDGGGDFPSPPSVL